MSEELQRLREQIAALDEAGRALWETQRHSGLVALEGASLEDLQVAIRAALAQTSSAQAAGALAGALVGRALRRRDQGQR